tara:strand:- start:902 stop:1726 length:825 start_codon:yes stop_codon:yes gene_type:complete
MTNFYRLLNIAIQKSLIFFYERINKGVFFNLYLGILKITNLFKSDLKIGKNVIFEYDKPFFLSRKSRFYMYSNGLNNRLEHLFNEYLLKHIRFNHNDLIIDCGANIGELGFYLNHKFEIKNILSIEPDKNEYETLKLNSKYSNYSPLNYALYNKNGHIDFYLNNDSADSSIFAQDNLMSISVKTITLNDLFKKQNIKKCKLLKLEAEGAEPEILEGGLEVLKYIEYISVDCGPERGINNEITIASVSKIIYKSNFSLIDAGGIRKILLFKNNLF